MQRDEYFEMRSRSLRTSELGDCCFVVYRIVGAEKFSESAGKNMDDACDRMARSMRNAIESEIITKSDLVEYVIGRIRDCDYKSNVTSAIFIQQRPLPASDVSAAME